MFESALIEISLQFNISRLLQLPDGSNGAEWLDFSEKV
jgi:hypothetical protein